MNLQQDLIYINNNSICKSLCNEIIEMFEEQDDKYEGITAAGLVKNIKDTTDYIIPTINSKSNSETINKWSKINTFLVKELTRNIKKYIKNLQENFCQVSVENSNTIYQIFDNNFMITNEFMIQKYTKNKGRYVYHDDFCIEWDTKRYRTITYIFYLNDVDDGGETEFWGNTRIKPEAGKLVLFPASWTYPHRGMMPKSSDKYIITGWLWLDNK